MINNLRYHLDGNKILVRWNYVDIEPNVTVTCKLCKRINGEEIPQKDGRRHDAITLQIYRSNGGGDWFEMPDCPVKVIVYENHSPKETRQEVDVLESLRYFIRGGAEVHTQPEQTVRQGLFGRKVIPARSFANFSITFPGALSAEDMKNVEGWTISGVLDRSDGSQERFFWPQDFVPGENRVNNFEIPVDPTINADSFHFEVVPEVKGTRFENMFTFSSAEAKGNVEQRQVSPIDLKRLKPRDAQGFYENNCPFCLRAFKFNAPVFRADIYPDETIGYGGEIDELYEKFYDDTGFKGNKTMGDMGKVLTWDQGTIRAYATASDPSTFLPYEPGMEIDDVVVAVRDDKNNVTANKLCPYCHHSIPPYSGKYPSVFINMMGNTGSGKTIYMSRLIQMMFRRELLPGYGLVCTANNNAVSREYQQKFDIIAGNEVPVERRFDRAGFSGTAGVGAPGMPSGVSAPGGMGAPGAAAPGMGMPGMGAPGAAAPGMGMPSMGVPGATAPGMGMPGMGVPGAVVPGMGMPGVGASGAAVPGMGIPGASAPASAATNADMDTFSLVPPSATVSAPVPGAAPTVAAPGAAPGAAMPGMVPMTPPVTPPSGAPAKPNFEAMYNNIRLSGADKLKEKKDPQRMLGATPVGFLEPCVYQLSCKDDADTGVILTFFDFPGEFIWEADRNRGAYYRYFNQLLQEIDGMVFLFDPMTIKCVENLGEETQREFSQQTYEVSEEKREEILRQRPLRIIETFKQCFSPVSRLQFPVVYAISKSDAIRDYLTKVIDTKNIGNLKFLDESRNGASSVRKGIDLEELAESSDSILNFMEDEDLRVKCEGVADNYIWMCVSALGIAPRNGTMKGRYGNPVRTLEPVEWLLYQVQRRNAEN